MVYQDFRPGDIIQLRYLKETRSAVVTDVNYNGLGLVNYTGYPTKEHRMSGSGAFDPAQVGISRFGPRSVEIIGKTALWRGASCGPRPGNRGYDLMC